MKNKSNHPWRKEAAKREKMRGSLAKLSMPSEYYETYSDINKETVFETHAKNVGRYDPNAIYLTVKELAEKIDVTGETIRWHIKKGNIKAEQFTSSGRLKLLIHPDEAERFLKEREK